MEDNPNTYTIVRFYSDREKQKEVVKEGLTLEEARDWCMSEDSTSGDTKKKI